MIVFEWEALGVTSGESETEVLCESREKLRDDPRYDVGKRGDIQRSGACR